VTNDALSCKQSAHTKSLYFTELVDQ